MLSLALHPRILGTFLTFLVVALIISNFALLPLDDTKSYTLVRIQIRPSTQHLVRLSQEHC